MTMKRYLRFLNRLCNLFQLLICFKSKQSIRQRFFESDVIVVYRIGNIGDIATAINSLIFVSKFAKKKVILVTSPGSTKGLSSEFFKLVDYQIINKQIIYYTDGGGIGAIREELKKYRNCPLYLMTSPLATLYSTIRIISYFRLIGFKYISGWEITHSEIFAKKINDESIKLNNIVCESERLLSNFSELYGISSKALSDKIRSKVIEAYNLLDNRNTDQIVLAPGSKRKTNRWEKFRYEQLIERLTSKSEIVVIGGDSEKEFGNYLEKKYKNVTNKCGVLDITDLLTELGCAKLMICNDSGPQHIAALLHVPTIVISSSRDVRGRWYPDNPKSRVLRTEVSCSACFKDECPRANLCINTITVDDVLGMVR